MVADISGLPLNTSIKVETNDFANQLKSMHPISGKLTYAREGDVKYDEYKDTDEDGTITYDEYMDYCEEIASKFTTNMNNSPATVAEKIKYAGNVTETIKPVNIKKALDSYNQTSVGTPEAKIVEEAE